MTRRRNDRHSLFFPIAVSFSCAKIAHQDDLRLVVRTLARIKNRLMDDKEESSPYSMKKTESLERPGICVSIAGENTNEALHMAREIIGLADVLEIRLDSLPSPDPAPFLDDLTIPLLFTNRPDWEGGAFKGGEEERIRPLLEAIDLGASYVDIELNADSRTREAIISEAKEKPARIIASWHNFHETPPLEELYTILQQMMSSGADIGKIVTMARNFSDALQVLLLQTRAHEQDFPLIAFCMGEAGRISRLATLELGGFMTYAAPGFQKSTAPGQLTVEEIKKALEIVRNGDQR